MQDRFKFRIWDKINKKWINKCLLDIESGYLCGYYDNEQAYKRRYKIMQSTGLKDKNGNLVYEGDIIQWCYAHEGKKVGKEYTDVVTHNPEKAAFMFGNYLIVSPVIIEKVLGNIYENEELLSEH